MKPNVLENADAQNFDSDYQVAAELTNSATSSEPVDEDAGEIACPTNDYGNRRMLIYKGVEYMVIEPDVITIETEAFGTVDFVPTRNIDGPDYIAFFLVDSKSVVYRLPASHLAFHFFISDSPCALFP